MVLPFLVLYLIRSLGWSPATAGLVLLTYGACSLVAAPLSGRLCDRYGADHVMVVSLALWVVAFLLFPLARSFPQVAFATVFLSLTSEAFRPARHSKPCLDPAYSP